MDGATFYSVSLEPGDPPVIGRPQRLFSLPAALGGGSGIPYDTDPNGDGFVMALARDDAAVRHLNVVMNWDEVLRKRLSQPEEE